MRKWKNGLPALALAFVLALSGMAYAWAEVETTGAAPQSAAAQYVDGSYSVEVELTGGSSHNALVSPTTVYVENGCIYADIVFKRVEAPFHAPSYDSLTTCFGTYLPEIDEEALTCTFRRVQFPDLGDQEISAVTSAMSQPHEVQYSVFIDPAGVTLTGPSPEEKMAEPDAPAADERTDATDGQKKEGRTGLQTVEVIGIAGICVLICGGAVYALTARKRKGKGA